MIDKDYETEAAKTDEDVVIEIANDNSNDCTQLPTTTPDISFTSLSALASADTQSNLDTLINLISETESDSENTQLNDNTNIVDNIHFKSLADASFTSLDDGKRKRKSHSRGCACCEKVLSFIIFIYV